MPLFISYIILYIFIFFTGAAIGSFLNVVVWRMANKLSFVKGRSFCPECKETIKPYDLIPIISYIILRGKCRNCKERIPLRYPLTEAVTGLLYLLCFFVLGLTWGALIACVTVSILIPVTMIDFETMEIPNGLIIALIVPAAAAAFLMPETGILERVIGFFAVSLPIFLLCLLIEDAFGGGDIKLLAVCGFLLGWKNIILAMVIALIIGSVVGLTMKYKNKIEKKQHIPFGPYICIGVYTALLCGNVLINLYMSLYKF